MEFDLLIFDSTPSGLIAAVAAARQGLRVAVITEDKHIGGMQTAGLGWTNAGQRATVGGLAREFYDRVHAYYLARYSPDSQQVKDCSDGFHWEPHVASRIYQEWMTEAGVTLITEEGIDRVEKQGTTLVAVHTERGRRIAAKMFIDASYEGDLFKLAGCSYHLGRESSAQYDESLAGVQYPPSQRGCADRAVQPCDYRLCLTDRSDNRVPFWKPANYNADTWAWHAARLKAKPPTLLPQALPLNPMPNRKTDSRTGEWIGGSWRFPEASREERRRIADAHRDYSAGFVWFLLHDAPLPADLRDQLHTWGLAADEFADNANWPYHIYVREARRLVGDFVMTQHDIAGRFQPDAVALGSFYLDVHPVQLVDAPDQPGGKLAEGFLAHTPLQPYEIAWRSLLPRRAEATNLLVSVCISSSHIAYSTIRMEPVYQMLGHAAGLAAALSLQGAGQLHDLPAATLQQQLREQGQRIDAREFNEYWPRG